MHGDHVSLAKKPELLAAGARRVAHLAEEESLAAQCVAAKISDTREALASAVKACDSLAAQAPSPTAAASPKTSKKGSRKEASEVSRCDSLSPYLRQHRIYLAERLQAVEQAQQEWLSKREAQVRELCACGGGDLSAVRAAEDDLAVDSLGLGNDNGGAGNGNGSGSFNHNKSSRVKNDKGSYSTLLHGDFLTLRGRRDLIDLVHKRLARLVQEDSLAQKLEDATERCVLGGGGGACAAWGRVREHP